MGSTRNSFMFAYVVAAMLLASNPVYAHPTPQAIKTSSHHYSPIVNDTQVISDLVDNSANLTDHVINKRGRSNRMTDCRLETVRQNMDAPILFFKLNEGPLTGLSYPTPMRLSYDECVFDGCSEQEIQHYKKINKRIEIAFHYDALSDLPGDLDAKPSYKLTYTKYITQCQAEQAKKSSKSIPKSEEENNQSKTGY